MKKEISPEMYNYNKYPGPSFARVGDKVVAENIELDLLENYKEAFDQTIFGQRFSPFMLKFDFIVGDWGNEQLRLKGFYKNDKVVKSDLKIGRLEDYLTEFCNFGCAYFVLGNNNPQELAVEAEDRPRKRRRSRNRTKGNQEKTLDATKALKTNGKQTDRSSSRNKKNKEKQTNKSSNSRHFTVKQDKRKETEQQPQKTKKVAQPAQKENKRNFLIRQK